MTQQQWPSLPLEEWADTCATLHMWTQVVGKIRLEQTPLVNHWWNVPLYVSARGLTTTAMPYEDILFEMEFDFLDHQLRVKCSNGSNTSVALEPKSVAVFYNQTMQALRDIGLNIKIWTMPVEIPNPISFEEDNEHKNYDPEYAQRFWRILSLSDQLFQKFRANHLYLIHRSIGLGSKSLKGRPVEMLEGGARHRFFPELWDIRCDMTDRWGAEYGRVRESISHPEAKAG